MKTYQFQFTAQKVEFCEYGASVAYGRGCTLQNEVATLTLPEALQRLALFSARISQPHAALLRMANRSDRVPPGFYKAKTTILSKAVPA